MLMVWPYALFISSVIFVSITKYKFIDIGLSLEILALKIRYHSSGFLHFSYYYDDNHSF